MQNNVAAGTVVAGFGSDPVLPGSDILTIRGVFSTPPYEVDLKPVLRLDGVEVAVGEAIGSAEDAVLLATLTPPEGSPAVAQFERKKNLLAEGIVSQRQFEVADRDLDLAQGERYLRLFHRRAPLRQNLHDLLFLRRRHQR